MTKETDAYIASEGEALQKLRVIRRRDKFRPSLQPILYFLLACIFVRIIFSIAVWGYVTAAVAWCRALWSGTAEYFSELWRSLSSLFGLLS